ncbi:hypothetical protein EVAR_39258_1 [Eumeta japonica]|uniref:Uncharacterized protein n=1 Tax=Eumeta variegata TaxID=151549 RepID=A0A4C1XZJ3_EUMVA|nr:hypothetical protein EVAR_39258_1 [Eumeta japonica]
MTIFDHFLILASKPWPISNIPCIFLGRDTASRQKGSPHVSSVINSGGSSRKFYMKQHFSEVNFSEAGALFMKACRSERNITAQDACARAARRPANTASCGCRCSLLELNLLYELRLVLFASSSEVQCLSRS